MKKNIATAIFGEKNSCGGDLDWLAVDCCCFTLSSCKYNSNLLYKRNKIAQPEVNKLVFVSKCVN